MIIQSGTGNGNDAGVDDTNRLLSRSVVEFGSAEAAEDGNGFLITSGLVTLTNAASSAVFWFQNEDPFELIMSRIIFSAGVSTGGTTNMCTLVGSINPSGLGSGSGNSVTAINSNFGSSNPLTLTSSEVGQQGATVTNGTTGPTFYFPDKLTSTFDSQVIIPQGTGIAFSVVPPASNTSISVAVSINVYKLVHI